LAFSSPPRLDAFFSALATTAERLQVRQHQFGFHSLDVPHRVHGPADVDHVGGLKAPDNMDQRIDLTDLGQKLVSQSLPLAGPLY